MTRRGPFTSHVLTNYLTKKISFLLAAIMSAGLGIYLLADLFDRLDNFLEAGLTTGEVLTYFAYKFPIIISQLLPAVFLLSLVVQFCLMAKNKELTALQAGGISPLVFLKFFLVYGLLCAALQFGFAEWVGVTGERASQRIWQEKVQKRSPDKPVHGIWFTEGNYVIHLGSVYPASKRGQNLRIYQLSADGLSIEKMIQASAFYIMPGNGSPAPQMPEWEKAEQEKVEELTRQAETARRTYWLLTNVSTVNTADFSYEALFAQTLPIRQNLDVFTEAKRYGAKGGMISIFELHKSITRLEKAGSNVEALRTNFHARIAYAASILVMSLLGLAITLKTSNLYLASCAALLITFAFYAVSTLGNSLGAKGDLPPAIAAWGADAIFFTLSVLYIFYTFSKDYRKNEA